MNDSCVWPVDWSCLPQDLTADEDRELLREQVDTAVAILWALSGRQFGCQRLTVRPCPGWRDGEDAYLSAGLPSVGFAPVLFNGAWRNVSCGGGRCRADGPSVVRLPGPAHKVESVVISGDVLDPAGYRLEGSTLYRAGGLAWPGQDLSRPLPEPGTWSVNYLRGTPPPAGAARHVATLAAELWAACKGDKCRLPKRWQSVTRQGVTIQRMDPQALLKSKWTGLPEVDMWLQAHNPNGLDQPTVIASHDTIGLMR